METGQLLIYQSANGAVKVDVRLENETVWLSQAQICTLFQKSKAAVGKHISTVFHEGELSQEVTVRKLEREIEVLAYKLGACEAQSRILCHKEVKLVDGGFWMSEK